MLCFSCERLSVCPVLPPDCQELQELKRPQASQGMEDRARIRVQESVASALIMQTQGSDVNLSKDTEKSLL